MEIGASSACFYPTETEVAFRQVCELGFPCAEIFLNSPCEAGIPFLKELVKIKEHYGVRVKGVHPYRSFAEGYELFSVYKRRFYDALGEYQRIFEAAAYLGADLAVLHGHKGRLMIDKQEYVERYALLSEKASECGCRLAQENVTDHVSQSPDFIRYMKQSLGSSFSMVLDIKQARRSGQRVADFIEAAGESIVHLHLSDYNRLSSCIPPCSQGSFDFDELFSLLSEGGYKGDGIIELYSDSFSDSSQILFSGEYLREKAEKYFLK